MMFQGRGTPLLVYVKGGIQKHEDHHFRDPENLKTSRWGALCFASVRRTRIASPSGRTMESGSWAARPATAHCQTSLTGDQACPPRFSVSPLRLSISMREPSSFSLLQGEVSRIRTPPLPLRCRYPPYTGQTLSVPGFDRASY